jgi:heme-degrading monooxygenase HmoA
MPHKYNAARRHHIPRPKRRVTNWAAYNEALRQRGSLTVWFTEDAIAAWKAAPRTTPGGQPRERREIGGGGYSQLFKAEAQP